MSRLFCAARGRSISFALTILSSLFVIAQVGFQIALLATPPYGSILGIACKLYCVLDFLSYLLLCILLKDCNVVSTMLLFRKGCTKVVFHA